MRLQRARDTARQVDSIVRAIYRLVILLTRGVSASGVLINLFSPLRMPAERAIYLFIYIQVDQKTGVFLRIDNFATVNGKKACNMSKVSEFYLDLW